MGEHHSYTAKAVGDRVANHMDKKSLDQRLRNFAYPAGRSDGLGLILQLPVGAEEFRLSMAPEPSAPQRYRSFDWS